MHSEPPVLTGARAHSIICRWACGQAVDLGELAALAVFSFVSAVTPGPNNVMLLASGTQFGLRATLPHLLGIVVGMGSMAIAVASGLGALITTVPEVELVLKVVGSAYLLYLAWQIAGSRIVEQTEIARPLSLWQAALFQYVNPKAWVFVVAAVTTFRPDDVNVFLGSVLMATTMVIVVFPSALVWAAGGTLINRFVTSDRAQRVLSIVLAVLLAATVAYIWI